MFGTWFKDPRMMACAMILFSTTSPACDDASMEDRLAAYKQHYPAISYPSLRKAMDAGEVFIIDSNKAETYSKGHLPGSHSLADRTTLESRLPVLKNYPIVVYCGGPQCPSWFSGADFAAARGYSNIMHYKGGLKDWKEQGETLATGKN
ncbi:MAG: rhodanese-like domain-containing protein [Endozoicomonas sp.]|uniref:rhodanese-like domain-containing protein n=1 Tax=Endozoicomonas sp. TaxID=1892382 RepID=UPI003D9AECBB